MDVIQEYKCPCCGGGITFDTESQKMKCPYCDTEFEIETLKKYNNELNSEEPDDMKWETEPGKSWDEGEEDALSVYTCNSCGGEIVGDETTAATACPFCGNPVVFSAQLSGSLKPDYVIPFKIDKKAAEECLRNHYKGKILLPKTFKDENHIEEVKGIYVPFWLFDADADANIRYRATRTRVWSDSKYNYTKTSYYLVHRSGNLSFAKVPVDGSSKMADDLMESIEPYSFKDAVDFNTAYLAGYFADKYDVNAEESIERANKRIKTSTSDAFLSTVKGYTSVIPESTNIRLHNSTAKYALYPVWILNTVWNKEKYTFAVNGQTGRIAGDLPLDKAAYKRWLFGLFGILGLAAFGISYLFWLL
ncbi:MAG: hypothetical protein E7652_06560 [Ruminococcaceae bacterium]|nr:hypothetical protein [Oscillospiraceae bacterium]